MLRTATLLVWILLSNCSSQGQTVALHAIRKVYVEPFQSDPSAAFIRGKLIQKLSRHQGFILVNHVEDSDAILQGSAAFWITGYYNPSPRIRYRTSRDVPVYAATLSLTLKDRQRNILWSASFRPRFWGSQYVSDNVTNQAACHLEKAAESR
jgi:hypothetical protein